MEFTQKDELGLERTYYLITQLELGNEKYVVYSDLLKDELREYRLLVGKIINGKVIRIDEAEESKVIEYFSKIEDDYKEYIQELI